MARRLRWVLFAVLVIVVCLNFKSILKVFFPVNYTSEVRKYAIEYKLDEEMVYAIIRVESKFAPDARSVRDARGLMQITTNTGNYLARLLKDKNFNEEQLFDPETNIHYGCFYFSKLVRDFGNDINCALAAYNGGEGNVRRWSTVDADGKRNLILKDIPYEETRNYVIKVNKYYKIYKYLYSDASILEFFQD